MANRPQTIEVAILTWLICSCTAAPEAPSVPNGVVDVQTIPADADGLAAEIPDAPAQDDAADVQTTPDSNAETATTADSALVADTKGETTPTPCAAAFCGDGQCTTGCETYGTCSKDCPVQCGDGACSPGENPSNCKEDCCSSCGDGKCLAYACGEPDKTSKN